MRLSTIMHLEPQGMLDKVALLLGAVLNKIGRAHV
jgi:hypothetical protein